MDENSITYQKALNASAVDGSLSCDKALALCKIFEFDHAPFREYCDANHITFTNCSTGSFE